VDRRDGLDKLRLFVLWSVAVDGTEARTRERILDGAVAAIARHGLAKLGMGDVSDGANVSRGTVYRYFPNRQALLRVLAEREGRRFQAEVRRAMEAAPTGAERLHVALLHAAQIAREHPVLQRLVETDPAHVLRSIREQYPAIRAMIHELMTPLLGETAAVLGGVATPAQLSDWLTRIMISAFLFPDPEPGALTEGLTSVYRMLTAGRPPRPATPTRSRGARGARRPRARR